MREKDQILFDLLKKKIVEVMQQSHPGINPSIAEWKGQEITDFQEDLRIRVNANLSEKWFYTHMKSTEPTLPRIDMLNILSRYAGYTNWDEFVFRNGQSILIPRSSASPVSSASGDADEHRLPAAQPRTANRYFILVPLIAVAVAAALFGFYSLFSTREYRFTFTDAETHEPIVNEQTEVTLLMDGESPVTYRAGKEGMFRLKTARGKVRMVVKAPYYQPDTVIRILRKFERNETVALKADDYALMIHYLSSGKVEDWEKRRQRLNELIGEGAMICQVISGREAPGMVVYTSQEFIDLVTMPSGSLKNIEILGSKVQEGKIVVLRFRTKSVTGDP